MPTLSRREFIETASLLATAGAIQVRAQGLTAQDVVDRIRASVRVSWREKTVDGFKAGSPATVVTGIAVTVMPTIDVLRRAVAGKKNLVIAFEPTFYTADDGAGGRAADPVYVAKKQLIDEHQLVVWRFSEHWNARRPREPVTALAARFGWSDGVDDIYQIPETTFGALVMQVRNTLALRGGLRTIGESRLPVRRVLVSPGTINLAATAPSLRRADVVLGGEPREWEAVPYTLDTWAAGGEGKGMIAIGRVVSQTPGVQACAAWIHALLPDVPVDAFAVEDPYWSPPV